MKSSFLLFLFCTLLCQFSYGEDSFLHDISINKELVVFKSETNKNVFRGYFWRSDVSAVAVEAFNYFYNENSFDFRLYHGQLKQISELANFLIEIDQKLSSLIVNMKGEKLFIELNAEQMDRYNRQKPLTLDLSLEDSILIRNFLVSIYQSRWGIENVRLTSLDSDFQRIKIYLNFSSKVVQRDQEGIARRDSRGQLITKNKIRSDEVIIEIPAYQLQIQMPFLSMDLFNLDGLNE